MKQGDVTQLENICLTYRVERKSDAKDVPDCSHHGIQEDGSNVLKKRATWHEIACIQDDGGQEIEEEDITVHNGRWLVIQAKDYASHDKANYDQ